MRRESWWRGPRSIFRRTTGMGCGWPGLGRGIGSAGVGAGGGGGNGGGARGAGRAGGAREQVRETWETAGGDRRPMCADTGLPRYYVKLGNEAVVEGGLVALERALREATAGATPAVAPRAQRGARAPPG